MSDSPDCVPGFRPNPDVSGVGVRTSFYAQAALLALLSARSPERNEIADSLTTLTVTNFAICVTTLYLGFKPDPELNLYDALVVCYLLLSSWTAIFFTLPQYNRFRKSDPYIKGLAIGQSYLVFATFLAVFQSAPTFGSCAQYNENARVVIFGPFNAVHGGRILGLVGTSILLVGYTVTVWLDYSKKKEENDAQPGQDKSPSSNPIEQDKTSRTSSPLLGGAETVQMNKLPRTPSSPPAPRQLSSRSHTPHHSQSAHYQLGVDGRVILHVVIILIVSTLAIVNTELLRRYNHPQPDDNAWGFGQILPVFLTVLPAKRTLVAFWKYGLGKKPDTKAKRVRVRPKNPPGATTPAGSNIFSEAGPNSPPASSAEPVSRPPEASGFLFPGWSPGAGRNAAAASDEAHTEEVDDSEESED